MTAFCVALMAVVAALVAFVAVSAGLDLKTNDPNAFFIAFIVLGLAAIIAVLGLFAAMLVAMLTARSLKKLPAENECEQKEAS